MLQERENWEIRRKRRSREYVQCYEVRTGRYRDIEGTGEHATRKRELGDPRIEEGHRGGIC